MTFRRKRTLAETLDSLLGQLAGHPDVEVLVSDNASGDGTAELVDSYRRQHPQLRYRCNERNIGADGNIVTCIQKGAGEYIAFFSDDDIAPPGHVDFLVQTLRERRPVVLYFNHRPFLHDDVNQLGNPASPEIDTDSDGGEEFLLTAGLGFLSSLVVAREAALPFLATAADGWGAPHVYIAGKIVLSRLGPCLYRGTHSIYARYEYSTGSILIGGCVCLARIYRKFVEDGLFSAEANSKWLGLQLRHLVPRQVLSARGRRMGEYPLRGMLELYGSKPSFYLLVLPLYLIPHSLIGFPYHFGRRFLHFWRRSSVRNKALS